MAQRDARRLVKLRQDNQFAAWWRPLRCLRSLTREGYEAERNVVVR